MQPHRKTDAVEQRSCRTVARGCSFNVVRAEAVAMDVTHEADVVQLVTRAQLAFGRLDIMICNAGFGYYGTIEGTPTDIMQRMMDVNFMGTFHGARAALPLRRLQ